MAYGPSWSYLWSGMGGQAQQVFEADGVSKVFSSSRPNTPMESSLAAPVMTAEVC
jgi:hypothetical protein